MIKGKYLLPMLSGLCLLLGCAPAVFLAGTATGIGAYKWYQGALLVVYDAPYMQTWDATLKAVEDMELEIRSKKHDLTTGKINARRADEKPVTVSVEYKNAMETEVKIRVGIFGDKDASLVIKERIREALFKGQSQLGSDTLLIHHSIGKTENEVSLLKGTAAVADTIKIL